MDGSSHPLTGNSSNDGDLEMGTVGNNGTHGHNHGGNGASSGAISSPGGGLVLRKKLVSDVLLLFHLTLSS